MEQTKEIKRFNAKKFFANNSALVVFIILVIVASIMSSSFFSHMNIVNILRQQVPYMLVAIGCMLVMMTGGIDLSCGAIVGVGNVVVALLIKNEGFSTLGLLFLAVALAALVGAILGLANGILVAYFKMAAFIVTLAMMTIAEGIAYIVSNGNPVRLPDNAAANALVAFAEVRDPLINVPIAVYVTGLVVVLFIFIVRKTSYGRLMIATGSNETAVRLSGINTNLYKVSGYVICGALSALAGVFVAGRSATGTPATTAGGYELDAIAAVVIGGANLDGGKASVLATLFGVLIMAIIGNMMNLMGVAAYPQKVVKGIIIIAAVLLKKVVSRK